MPTPTEVLDDLLVGYALVYATPTFGAVQNGAATGDKYISATVATSYALRVDYRVGGNATWTNNWTVTLTGPTDPAVYLLREISDEDATDVTLLSVITDYMDALTLITADFTAAP